MMDEGLAEWLALSSELCICQPKGMPHVYHLWADEPKIEVLDEDGDVVREIVQCGLCGKVVERNKVVVKRLS